MGRRAGTGYEDTLLERYPSVQKTSNSGATHGDGDLRHPGFLVEAKDHGTEGFSLSRTDFLKIKRQAANWSQGQWAYFFRNASGEETVMMNIELFNALLDLVDQGYEVDCPHCGEGMTVEIDL